MGTMLPIRSYGRQKRFCTRITLSRSILPKLTGKRGIHIHDLDFIVSQLLVHSLIFEKLFEEGFDTGHGFIRTTYQVLSPTAALALYSDTSRPERATRRSVYSGTRPLFREGCY